MKKRIYMDIDEEVHECLRKRSFDLKLPMKKLLESMINSFGKEIPVENKKELDGERKAGGKRMERNKKGMEKS